MANREPPARNMRRPLAGIRGRYRAVRAAATAILGAVCLMTCTPVVAVAVKRLPPYKPDANAARKQIPDVYKWDLTPLFASDEAWEAALTKLDREVDDLAVFKGQLGDAGKLKACLDLYFRIHNEVSHVTMYASLRHDTHQADDAAQAMTQRGLALMNTVMQKAAFIRGELLALSDAQTSAAYSAEPGLGAHRVYIDNLRRRKDRLLPPEAERVLSLMGDNLWAEIDLNELPSSLETTFGALLTDIPWPKVHDDTGRKIQLTLSNYGRLRASKNRTVRREAVTKFLATLRRFQHAMAAALAGQYQLSHAYAQARNYDTVLDAYLDKDDLQSAVYDNLISTVSANLAPLHRYIELRKRALKIPKVHLYDLYVPFIPGVDKEVPFSEAREIVLEALKPLGQAYTSVVAKGLDPNNGWLDLYPSKDKQSGAFCASVYGRHPYIKMNYQNRLDDMSTLVHEFGHALHAHLSMSQQPYSSSRYAPFLAEIASTCNEALLNDHLIANAKTKAEKAYLLSEQLEGIRTTIVRQTLFAEFEKTVHSYVETGKPVTAQLLDETYTGLLRKYYGPHYTIGPDDGMEWAYIPHLYYKYYVFTYATGLSSGIAIANRVKQGDTQAVEGLLAMLGGGCSEPPLELLKKTGVDLTRPDAVEAAMKRFADTLAELEKLTETND